MSGPARRRVSRLLVAGFVVAACTPCWSPAVAQLAASAPTTGVAMPGATPNFLAPGVKADLAFGAFQRGYFLTAFREAMKRIEADNRDSAAMALIGELYRDGLGVRADPGEAARWYKLAADRGDVGGAFALALAYLRARGVAEDRATARVLLEKIAPQPHIGALYNLGLMAAEDSPPDFRRAADYFRKATDLGAADAAYALALLYKEGRGVERNLKRSVELLRIAAAEHIVAAEIDLGIAYFNGEGVEANSSVAASYFRRAAEANNPVAANRLARILAAGAGVQPDIVEAMKWHVLARAAGVEDAWLDGELGRLTPPQRAEVEQRIKRQVQP